MPNFMFLSQRHGGVKEKRRSSDLAYLSDFVILKNVEKATWKTRNIQIVYSPLCFGVFVVGYIPDNVLCYYVAYCILFADR